MSCTPAQRLAVLVRAAEATLLLFGIMLLPPGRALAASFVLAGPVAGETWGETLDQPIASATTDQLGRDLRPDIASGTAWLPAEVAAISRLPPTLDSAREQDWYGLRQNLIVAHFGHGIAVPQPFQQTLHQKQVDAEPALLAELDSRFTVLDDQIVSATSTRISRMSADFFLQEGRISHKSACRR